MKEAIILLTVLFSVSSYAHTLTVKLVGIRSQKGFINYLLFDSEKGFPDHPGEKTIKGRILASSESIEFQNLSDGQYALTLFHDENSDNKLGTNFLGIPKEAFGFSNNPTIYFGPPSFNNSSFQLSSDMEISIKAKQF